MTTAPELPDTFVPDVADTPAVDKSPPILITEQQVAFSTAAALPVRPATRPRWIEQISAVLAALERMLVASPTESAAPRRNYPRRYGFLEHSCMAREMDRL
jgi:hypothetical protein